MDAGPDTPLALRAVREQDRFDAAGRTVKETRIGAD